jgi:putative acyl-CoA dehydrogenase
LNQDSFLKTHDVLNQTPPMTGLNAYLGDPLMMQITKRLPQSVRTELEQNGKFVLSGDAQDLARLANIEVPKLRTHDRQGHRIDVVDYHPAYHALMRRSVSQGLHSSIWEDGKPEAGSRHQSRAARFYLTSQLECGHLCPLTMTSASLAALMAAPNLYREWSPLILPRKYDSSNKSPAKKTGLTLGMGMTEKQGGTDVHTNTTKAEPAGSGFYRITGHKWFMSAPMSDAFLVLAQAREGLSCFLVPRILPDGSSNGFRFQRLKDKLGNRSNASSEVEFDNALGQMVGNPGDGIKTIIDMVTLTRLDCAIASAGLMRLARAFDNAAKDRGEAAFARVMTPVVKYWVAKIAPAMLYEAMECLGGNGYIEEGNLARYYREAPVNAIWEGSGNVMALDVLRVLKRGPQLFDEVLNWIGAQLGRGGQGTVEVLRAAMRVAENDEGAARILTEQLALAAAGAELRHLQSEDIADAFIETRLGGQWRTTYGMLDARHNAKDIISSLYPAAG